MDAQKSRSRRIALIVTENHFRQLDEILKQSGKTRDYKALMEDDLTVQCTNLEDFIRHASTSHVPLKGVEVATNPTYEKPSITISLGGEYVDVHTITYDIKGSETEVPYLDGRLESWISEVQPWYSWIATIDILEGCFLTLVVLFVSLVILIGCLFLLLIINGIPIRSSSSSSSDATLPALYIFLLFLFVYFGAGAFLTFARRWVFPVLTFAIGSGLKKHKRIVAYRRILYAFVSLFIPLLIGLLANWISRGWK